jgi:hypothetical protein
MALFGRKKDEEDYEDEDELSVDEERSDRKLTRKFKDLKSENRKKRKEPPKPWGKKERILVLSIMALTLLISGVLALIARRDQIGVPTFNFNFEKPNFGSFSIFKEETIEIRKK